MDERRDVLLRPSPPDVLRYGLGLLPPAAAAHVPFSHKSCGEMPRRAAQQEVIRRQSLWVGGLRADVCDTCVM